MDYSTSIDVHRIGQVLAFAPDDVLIFSTDGRLRSMPRVCISGSMLPGDISVLSADGQLRAYLRSNNGDIPIEALDAQLLAEAQLPVRPAWSGLGVPTELSEHVAGQLKARMHVLIEWGVVLEFGQGRASLALDWEERYAALRWMDLGVGVGGPSAGAGRHEGVLLDMGLLNESGERCLVLDTAEEGMVMIASPVTRLRVGGKFEVTRAHARQHWAIRSR